MKIIGAPRPEPTVDGFTMIELLISTLVLSIALAILTSILVTAQTGYLEQRQLMEIQTDAVAALDNIGRLVRMAGSNPNNISNLVALDPDPDNNNVFDSIHVQADWNPADGVLDDAYEDVTFTTSNDVLMIQESNAGSVPYLEGISALSFAFLDGAGVVIGNPETNVADIVAIRITLTARTVGTNTMTFDSSAAIRSRLH